MGWGIGLGRDRTRVGKWCDRNDITQEELVKWSGLSRPTICKICGDSEYEPTELTKRSLIRGLTKHEYDVDEYDFWR